MRVLFLTHSFNSLAQRLWIELIEAGHDISIEFDINDHVTREAVAMWSPDVIIGPFLKRRIPNDVWRNTLCLIVHPGIVGDRGPSALDWAILEGRADWGVTLLQAEENMDAGPVWAHRRFPMRPGPKSSLYRNEVTEAAVDCVLEALQRLEEGAFEPTPLAAFGDRAEGLLKPAMRQADRAIDWQRDNTQTVLLKIWASDGQPGVEDRIGDHPVRLHDAHVAEGWTGPPGRLLARCNGAVCRATVDGAVWIGHLRARQAETGRLLKRTAEQALGTDAAALPEAHGFGPGRAHEDISFDLVGEIGVLKFPFYNGAMSVACCERLLGAFKAATATPAKAILLAGGEDFWSNGMDLNSIEAAPSPADTSWANINAIDDLAEAIITTTDRWVVAALQGNTGAGGVFLALAADETLARDGAVLNPHYKNMGNLYGSEYWTYLLPRKVGQATGDRIMANRMPIGARQAAGFRLVDEVIGGSSSAFLTQAIERTQKLVAAPGFEQILRTKAERRARDEVDKPLARYRHDELERMRLNFYGFDTSYHVARYNFVTKVPHSRTPLHLARHRRQASAQV